MKHSVQKAALAELEGRKGTIGVYNYETGEILCAVTAPTYDPDHMPNVEADVAGAYEGAYMNRFYQMTYVPGSIYKIVTTAAALEELPDVTSRRFYCAGSCEIGADTINCNGTHHSQTLSQALANSCNVAFAQIAVELGEDTLTRYAKKFGITDSLKFDGIHTAAGKIDLSHAADSEIAWSGIGQYTNLVNPCQFMTLMGAIAGGSEGAYPHIVEQVEGGFGSKGYSAETETFDIGLSEETCKTLSQYMQNNVVSMYGQWLFPNLTICAKSGTAEVGPEQTPHATFAGFIQDANYPLAFIVIVENGGSGGGIVAYAYTKAQKASLEWRDGLYDALIRYTGLKGNRANPKATANHYVTRETTMPAVLLELGFMDSRTDVPIILTDAYAQKCAKAIVEVVVKRVGLTRKPVEDEGYYRVQLGAFRNKGGAEQIKAELEKQGYKPYITKS